MLIMFKTKNFASFKDEVVLDLRAASYKQHTKHVLDVSEGLKLLKTTAIYGANAAGKSNLISAMYFFKEYIFGQFISRSKNDVDSKQEKNFKTDLEPFMLTDNISAVSEFEIIFLYNEKHIQYGFECTSDAVLNEWYFIDDKKVFERKGNKTTYGKDYTKQLKPFNKVSEERLYISVLEHFLEKDDKVDILQDFILFFTKAYNVHLELFFEASIKKIGATVRLHEKLLEDEQYRRKVENYLQRVDVGISGLDIQTRMVLDEDNGKEKTRKILKTIHLVYNDEGEVTKKEYFDLFQESTGTLRFLSYIQSVIDMTEQGGVFIVDEMSARLHPLLTKLIVDIFQSSSNKKAQLVFTTHDISLFNKEQFRRDEIVFIDKNNRGVSKIYALSDLKVVREDATFDKNYLQGKYGAIPIFDYDAIIGGDNDGND